MTTANLALSPLEAAAASASAPSLKDMLEDGIYLLFLLRNGNPPASAAEFNQRIDHFLALFEKNARNFGKSPDAVTDAKYAFCALLDEIVLSSDFPIREDWERAPLQLRLFGEHLAGEGFFDKLENLRLDPERHVETLEVFHTCLLLGFQGRYLIEGQEKLGYLVARLGQEIIHARGGKAEFAPNAKLPFKFQDFVRHELPLWLYFALLAVVATALFLTYHTLLGNQLDQLAEPIAKDGARITTSANETTPPALPR